MSAGQPGQETRDTGRDTGQWPGPPPAAERKAAAVEDDFARDGTDAPPTEPRTDTGAEPRTQPPPGAVQAVPGHAADGAATLLEPDHTEEFRRRWDAIKASFVDDPRQAVRRAEELAEEVMTEVARTAEARRRDLIERREGVGDEDDKTGTERLRVVLHGYRGVLDPVLRP